MSSSGRLHPITPRWPAPSRVRAASSTRTGGTSSGPWRTLNLADHVGDDGEAVRRNRARLRHDLDLPEEPRWLVQRHGAGVVEAATGMDDAPADGIVARASGIVCAVLTADCMPVLLCDRDATVVAATLRRPAAPRWPATPMRATPFGPRPPRPSGRPISNGSSGGASRGAGSAPCTGGGGARQATPIGSSPIGATG